eukprot:8951656-Alexandrium_andersonii.AAC.1
MSVSTVGVVVSTRVRSCVTSICCRICCVHVHPDVARALPPCRLPPACQVATTAEKKWTFVGDYPPTVGVFKESDHSRLQEAGRCVRARGVPFQERSRAC